MMILSDFYLLVDTLLANATNAFTLLNQAIIIDDPQISLFELAFGFVVLEFLVYIINRFRGHEGDFASANQSTGKQPLTKIGDIQRSANRRNR